MKFEKAIMDFIDEIKFFLFPDKWSQIFMEHSKNEILVLFYLYKYREANMTKISEYIEAPLNTSTGVVNRLVKSGYLERVRDEEDRRIVHITLTDKADEIIKNEINVFGEYYEGLMEELTEDELSALISVYSKVKRVFSGQRTKANTEIQEVKKVKRINIE